MKTLVYSTHGYDMPFLKEAAKDQHQLTFTESPLDSKTVEMAKEYESIALFSNDNASAPILEKLYGFGVKYIALRSVGYDHVDLHTAKMLGIKIANVPEYSPHAIAEHAVAMLMMLNRKLYDSQLLIQMQDFRLDSLVGFDLNNKKIGIIGTGKIGMVFAKIMNGFGCKLLGYDLVENPEAKDLNMTYTSLVEMLEKCDIISLNCPLNEHTKQLLGEAEFKKMKKGAILINTARGGVICTESLLKYLENGHLGGACLDVYEKEKGLYFFDHRFDIIADSNFARLHSLKNVLLTGHQAFLTKEALSGIAETTISNLTQWSKNGASVNDL
ncbi:NAD(P)-dependent oxidoreductase [Flavobacterium faecale]|uniref:NAD(P)-dependent oxidoreductase n=1 Tax=Flavobacterium faecale TaxID=1355330 RepID=UPI003AACD452